MKTCKDCIHFSICDKFGCFEVDVGDNTDYKICKDFMENEVVHAHWIEGTNWYKAIECSNCGELVARTSVKTPNYCPNCGAKIDSVFDEIKTGLEQAIEYEKKGDVR